MKSPFALVLVLSLCCIPALEAAVYKGQKAYMQKCRKCHGGGQKMAASKRMKDWKDLLNKKNKGSGLANLHLENEKAKKSWSYFDSKQYRKSAKHIRDFMVEYANDSGNVPACN